MQPLRVFHLITGLGDGGVEAILYSLLSCQRTGPHFVLSLSGQDKYTKPLSAHATVFSLNLYSLSPNIFAFFGFIHRVFQYNPNAIQGWMYHGCFAASIISLVFPKAKLFWSLHNTILEPGSSKRLTILISKLLSIVSHFSKPTIIYCADSAMSSHISRGYASSRSIVINNGYDFTMFKPSESKSFSSFQSGSIATFNLSMIARFDPYKDHHTLLQALSILNRQDYDFHCFLVGKGVDSNNLYLSSLIAELDIQNKVILCGQISNIPRFLSNIDVNLLSSTAEAFPNVLVESMACGVPCVSTNVGDASKILDGLGEIVPPSSPALFADGIIKLIKLKSNSSLWYKLKSDCSLSVSARFSIEKMSDMYNIAWHS